MAVTGVLTKRSGALVEFQHALRSTDNAQENKEHLRCLSQSLKKLQSDVNYCLTEIIMQETTTVRAGSASHSKDSKEASDEEDGDDSDDASENNNTGTKNGGAHEPQAKKLRT